MLLLLHLYIDDLSTYTGFGICDKPHAIICKKRKVYHTQTPSRTSPHYHFVVLPNSNISRTYLSDHCVVLLN